MIDLSRRGTSFSPRHLSIPKHLRQDKLCGATLLKKKPLFRKDTDGNCFLERRYTMPNGSESPYWMHSIARRNFLDGTRYVIPSFDSVDNSTNGDDVATDKQDYQEPSERSPRGLIGRLKNGEANVSAVPIKPLPEPVGDIRDDISDESSNLEELEQEIPSIINAPQPTEPEVESKPSQVDAVDHIPTDDSTNDKSNSDSDNATRSEVDTVPSGPEEPSVGEEDTSEMNNSQDPQTMSSSLESDVVETKCDDASESGTPTIDEETRQQTTPLLEEARLRRMNAAGVDPSCRVADAKPVTLEPVEPTVEQPVEPSQKEVAAQNQEPENSSSLSEGTPVDVAPSTESDFDETAIAHAQRSNRCPAR